MSFSIAQDNNAGSIAALWIAPVYTFTALNPVTTFTPGNDWIPIDFLEESAQLTDESAETDNGLQYTYTLILSFNKRNSGLLASIAPYLGTAAIFKIQDTNGLTQIIGNLQSPITLKQNSDTGKAVTDLNSVLITAAVVQDTPAIILADVG